MAEPSSHSSTQWSLIVRAQADGPEARAAMGELIGRYEKSIVWMIRRWRHPPNQTAEEIKQEFLTRLLARNDVAALDRCKGSFRGWLNNSVRWHLANTWKKWHAKKNPDSHTEYPDFFEASSGESPEHLLCQKMAIDTLEHVLEQLRVSSRDSKRFDELRRFLPGPEMCTGDVESASALLGIAPTAVRAAVHHLRQDFKRLLEQAVADTLDIDPNDPSGRAELECELRLLYRSLYDRSDPTVHSRSE